MSMARARSRLGLLALAAGLTLRVGTAAAQDDDRFYFSPMGTYVQSDDDRHADDGVGGTLAFGVPLSHAVHLELRGTWLQYDGEAGYADKDLAAGGLGVNVYFAGPGGPYLHGDVMGGDETLFNIGLGWDLPIGKSFGLRAEALYHHQSNSTDGGAEYKEPLFNLGFRIPLGAPPEPPPPPAPPAPVVVVPPAPPPPACSDRLDNDGDGLIDYPADPGCESTGDDDETDPPPACKTPPPGEAVSLDGCGVGDVIVLRGVNFDFDKSTLTVNARSLLDGVAEALARRPDVQVEVGGHTDAKGSDSYNERLSDRRAKSVKTYLVSRGVAAERMTTRGYGESQPVAGNETDEGRELNRRVELKVTASDGGVSVAPSVPQPATAPAASPAPMPAAAANASAVTLIDRAFSPASITVPAGTTVTWTNEDGASHFVTFADAASSRLSSGATYTRTFTTPGVYPYTCSLHASMKGTVIVE